jgi:hypothetical protein
MTQSEFKYCLIQAIGFEPTEIYFNRESENFTRVSIKQNTSIDNKVFNSYPFEDFAHLQLITFSIIGPQILYITFLTKLIDK